MVRVRSFCFTIEPEIEPRSQPTSTSASSKGLPSSVLTFTGEDEVSGFSRIRRSPSTWMALPGSTCGFCNAESDTPNRARMMSTTANQTSRFRIGRPSELAGGGLRATLARSTSPSIRPRLKSQSVFSPPSPKETAIPASRLRPSIKGVPAGGVRKYNWSKNSVAELPSGNWIGAVSKLRWLSSDSPGARDLRRPIAPCCGSGGKNTAGMTTSSITSSASGRMCAALRISDRLPSAVAKSNSMPPKPRPPLSNRNRSGFRSRTTQWYRLLARRGEAISTISCTARMGTPISRHGPIEIGKCGSSRRSPAASSVRAKSRLITVGSAEIESAILLSAPRWVSSGWAASRSGGTSTSSGRVSTSRVTVPSRATEHRKSLDQSRGGRNTKRMEGKRRLVSWVSAGADPVVIFSVAVRVTVPSAPTSAAASCSSMALSICASSPSTSAVGGQEVLTSSSGQLDPKFPNNSVNFMSPPCWTGRSPSRRWRRPGSRRRLPGGRAPRRR